MLICSIYARVQVYEYLTLIIVSVPSASDLYQRDVLSCGLRVQNPTCHSVLPLGSLSWSFECDDLIWATSHVARACAVARSFTTQRPLALICSARHVKCWCVFLAKLRSKHCRDVCIACRPWVLQVRATSRAGLTRCTIMCFSSTPCSFLRLS